MAIKPFEIQSPSLVLAGVQMQAGTTGVVIPGVTQATSYTVNEVDDTGDQTDTWGSIPTVIDNGYYTILDGGSTPSGYSRPVYEVTELDGDGYIDDIEVTDVGAFPSSYESTVTQNMWATTVSDPFTSFNPSDWTQIPFAPQVRAGEIENVGGSGSSISNGDSSVNIDTSDGDITVTSNGTNVWTFDTDGALNLPSGNATPMQRGQILSDNESGFINLDVQFNIEPGQEGGVRLGTGASRPVDIRAGSNEWRFDSDGSLTVPGVIKSIGSYTYRGFYAVLNQISGDDPSINQIVLSRSSSISGSNPTTDTDDDNFIVTGINGSNITAIVNLYGQSTSVPIDTEELFNFIRSYIDLVLYDGNTQRTSISDIRIAFEVNESELLGPENFTSGTIVDNMNFNCIQAIVPASDGTTTGSGTGAVFLFDCDPLATGSVDYNTVEWNYNSRSVPGTGYQVGDTITLPGTTLGGAAPADNMTITVNGINGSGGITSFTTTGTMSQASYEQCIVKRYIYNGVSDIYDQGNFLGTDVSRCVFTAYTDADSNLVVTSVTSGGLYPWMTFYEPTNQTYPMVIWQTDGVTEGGTGTYVCGGYDTLASNLPSTTYTAYGMYYGVGETITGTNENWGSGTYGSMVGNEGNGIFSMVSLDGTASVVSYAGNTGSDSDGTKAAISQFAIGAVSQSLDLLSNTSTWTFGTDGNLKVPGNINAAATGSFPFNTTIINITTGSSNVYVSLDSAVFPGPVTGKVSISGVVGTVEANQTWWFQASDVGDIQLFTDSTISTPANGTSWLPYMGGGTAVSVTYDNLVIGAGVLSLGNPNRQWAIFEDGSLVAPGNSSIYSTGNVTLEVLENNNLTNVINVPVNQTFTGAWNTATYSDNSGTGRIDIDGSSGSLRRFVQLYMQNANYGTALVTINNATNKLTYNGFEYIGNTFTIYVVQSPGDAVTVTTMTLDAVMENIIELNNADNNAINIKSTSGWPINITSGYQGDVNISAGDDIFINAGTKTTADSTGGQLGFNGGDGGAADTQDPAGNGGGIDIVAGDGGVASNIYGAGNGGYTFVSGGNGGGANAAGGTNAGDGGSLALYAGLAGSNDGDINLGRQGGNVEIQAGYATGSFVGGNVSITAGQGGTGYGSGNIVLATQASDHTTNYIWQYKNDGGTIYPTLTVTRGDRTGTLTGQTLLFGDSTQSVIISTPDGTANINDSQRLIINPGAGYTGTIGEGGDIYLYAGRGGDAGGSGGDIKIRGGLAPADGVGGYLDISGGEAAGNGAGGYIEIIGGQSTGSVGGYVRIIGGQGISGAEANLTGGVGSAGPGGAVNIAGGTSSNGLAEYGNINITSGSSTWTFDNASNLALPGATGALYGEPNFVGFYSDNDAAASNGVEIETNVQLDVFSGGNVIISSGVGNVTEYNWSFDTTGNINLPTNTFAVKYANGTQVSLGGSPNALSNSSALFTLMSDNTLLSGNSTSPQNFKVNDTYTPDIDLRNTSGTGMFTQGANLTIRTAGTYNWNLDNAGGLSTPGAITSTGKIGYANGGSATQSASGSSVTVNQLTGIVTMAKNSWTAGDTEFMLINCNKVASDDFIMVQCVLSTYAPAFNVTAYPYPILPNTIAVWARALETLSDTIGPKIQFFIMKAPTA